MADSLERRKRRLGLLLGACAVAMFSFGYLVLVPLYNVLCKWTGQNDVGEASAAVNTQVDKSRFVTVEFDTNISRLPWQFRAKQNSIKVHPGELQHVMFEVRNEENRPITGQAIPSYGPALAAAYFHKLECFCFHQQTLAPHEVREMPVIFVVDPALPRDVSVITLSYTFFQVNGRGA